MNQLYSRILFSAAAIKKEEISVTLSKEDDESYEQEVDGKK